MALSPTLELIDLIYDAASEPERWDEALIGIAGVMDGSSAFLIGRALEQSDYAFYESSHADSRAMMDVCVKWMRKNPIVPKANALQDGGFLNTEEILPPGEAADSEFFQEVLKPLDMARGYYVSLFRRNKFICQLSIWRNQHQEAFADRAINAVRPFLPHLRRAAMIQLRLKAYHVLASNQQHLLDQLDTAIILVDETGAARCANQPAEAMVRARDGLTLTGSRLGATECRSDKYLAYLIAATMRGGAGGAAALRRRGRDEPLVALVCPLRGTIRERIGRPGEARDVVALFINDPTRGASSKLHEVLIQLHGLTPAEARVAARLAAGFGVVDTAQLLDLSINTVKTHARRIYEKAGISSQSELVQLYGRLAPPTRH